VHSPAAYFADLLAYPGDRASTIPGMTARDVLFSLRPDLGEIELTCANTNTVLPYTDLVNELLESRIAPFVPFDLAAAAEAGALGEHPNYSDRSDAGGVQGDECPQNLNRRI
jgi:hypothetical protein